MKAAMKKEIEHMLTVGSTYRIISDGGEKEPVRSTGEFLGYAAFATETALVLKLDETHGKDKGVTRIIPYHAILALDVLKAAQREEEKREELEERVYYR
jgi:hypothetical protein